LFANHNAEFLWFYPDIDECLSMPCDVEANCTNTNGSFSCMCNIGYAGNGFSCIGNLFRL